MGHKPEHPWDDGLVGIAGKRREDFASLLCGNLQRVLRLNNAKGVPRHPYGLIAVLEYGDNSPSKFLG